MPPRALEFEGDGGGIEETADQERGFNRWANQTHGQTNGPTVLRQLWEVCRDKYFENKRVLGGVYQINGISREVLASLPVLGLARLPGQDPQVNGAFWAEFAHCTEVFRRGAKSERHPRWQVNFSKGLNRLLQLITPTKGGVSSGKEAKAAFWVRLPTGGMVFQQGLWDSFKALGSNKPDGRNFLKVPVHSLRYAASPKMAHARLPDNPGRGGSLSHYCDLPGCTGGDAAEHLGSETAHQANLDRQRCPGAILMVASVGGRKAVAAVQLCAHSAGDIGFCCRKVVVTDIGDLDQLKAGFSGL